MEKETNVIIYRACPAGFAKNKVIEDKHELVNLCFNSMLEAFDGIDYQLIVLLDKPSQKFRKLFEGHDVRESFFGDLQNGNVKSFHKQLDLVMELKKDYLLVEDDYYFLPESGNIINEAISSLPFITPYDHPDYYYSDLHAYKRDVIVEAGHHWQTVDSTTLTFGGQYEVLKEMVDTIKDYGITDHPMWKDVTGKYPLYSPIPTLSTHMETEFISPVTSFPF